MSKPKVWAVLRVGTKLVEELGSVYHCGVPTRIHLGQHMKGSREDDGIATTTSFWRPSLMLDMMRHSPGCPALGKQKRGATVRIGLWGGGSPMAPMASSSSTNWVATLVCSASISELGYKPGFGGVKKFMGLPIRSGSQWSWGNSHHKICTLWRLGPEVS